MKKFILLLTIVGCFQFSNAQPIASDGCSDLFFSELTFGKLPNGTLFELNFAVEIFNPTNSSINLSSYELQLVNSIGTTVPISLTGSIAAGEVFVVCNSNAGISLQNIADQLTASLDFENNVAIELKNAGTTIDRVGQTGTSTSGSIDIVQLVADPYNYLLGFHVDLNDYDNIDIRRGAFVDKGNPNFIDSTTQLITDWYYFLNIDISDIGTHTSICNKPEGSNYVQYDHPLLNDLYTPFTASALLMNFTGGSTTLSPTMVNTLVTSGTTAIFNSTNSGHHARFSLPINYTEDNGECPSSLIVGITNCESILYTNNNFSGIKTVEFQLSSLDPDILVPIGAANHIVTLHGTPAGIPSTIFMDNTKVWPSITSTYLNIETSETILYTLMNLAGQRLQIGKIADSQTTIDVSSFPSGFYFLVLTAKDKSYSVKFLKD